MRAAFYRRQGPATQVLELGDLPDPVPGPGEVLVALATSGVNPSDVKLRAGSRPMGADLIVPQSDGAGRVLARAPGTEGPKEGARVWIWNGQWQRPLGTAASLIAIPAAQAVPLPDAVSDAEGACLGIPAMTAARAVFCEGPVDGCQVLVSGGAGSVARYAIQMAKARGATVTATVSTPEKAAYALAAGADHTVFYHSEDAAAQILDLTGGIHHAVELEFGVNAQILAQVMRINGTIAAYGSAQAPTPEMPFMAMMFKDLTLRMILVYSLAPTARAAAQSHLMELLIEGALTHAVAAEYPLKDVAKAHMKVEAADKLGTVVLTL
ncbi:MAG: NADPH:quinone reductase [Pseudomonadota bacterium]